MPKFFHYSKILPFFSVSRRVSNILPLLHSSGLRSFSRVRISPTGCSLNIVFFSEFFKIFRTLSSLGVSLCTQSRQVENQRCCRTGRVQKNHKILRQNTIFNEHPVSQGFQKNTGLPSPKIRKEVVRKRWGFTFQNLKFSTIS